MKRTAAIFTLFVLASIFVVIANTYIIYSYGDEKIYEKVEHVEQYEYGILFGAGVNSDGTAEDPLADRLKLTAELYNEGKIEKILVSGDNSDSHNNETDAMIEILTEKFGVSEEDIIEDEKGVRTFETCKRAGEQYDIEEALLITQGFHLRRAIYTCDKLGVESAGISATSRTYEGHWYYEMREFFAINRAWIDLQLD
ncbi:MAG: ElyC/SanA/YdcF family protein [Candidatus Dojkabacteria bacterium]|nr:MAG: ElyC/SanA/YdcF family protein [Candidatus Dojkabacteria bacterium]